VTDLQQWLGRERVTEAVLDPWPVRALSAVLDLPLDAPVSELPGLWHWLYFLETAATSRIGPDGHPLKGDFLPPVPHPRRMFAGGRTRYHQSLRIGAPTQLLETVTAIKEKPNARGGLYIVSVGYHYRQDGALCVEEERDFIYLPAVTAPAATAAASKQLQPVAGAQWSLDVATDPVLLMRFSALTFNSHRIHYDLDYARQQEGYPDLVVHGPLSAILLSELVRLREPRTVSSFSFRALSPLFAGQTLRLRGDPVGSDAASLTVFDPAGAPALTAQVTFSA
jgi:3-methylfumaryl-CoA hydratase